MSSPFVAEIKMFAGNFPPTGYATCDGQLMPISQNTALFSLLGTFYGGDGKSTFALPNLQGSAPMGQGQGPGLSDRFIGEAAGEPFVTLITSEMPQHNHQMMADGFDIGDNRAPAPEMALAKTVPGFAYKSGVSPDVQMSFQTIATAGSSFPHNNMQPFLTVTFIIALQGIFPPRS